MDKILMTGGSGFVGTWLRKTAPGRVDICALDELQYKHGDWHRAKWDAIIHLAPVDCDRVIECAKRNNAMILYSSSGAVHDEKPGTYASMKRMGEHQLLSSRLPVKIARMYTFAGPHMPNHFAIINYIVDAIEGGPIRIRGDNVTRSYLYAEDMALWMWRIYYDGEIGRTYDVGSSQPITMHQLAERVAARIYPHPQIVFDRMYYDDPRPVYLPRELETIKRDLAVQEWTQLDDAIDRTIEYYANKLRCYHAYI